MYRLVQILFIIMIYHKKRAGIVQTGINSQYDKKKECPSSQTDGKYQAKCLVLLHTFWQWIEGLSLSYLCQRVVLLIVDTLTIRRISLRQTVHVRLDNGVGNDYNERTLSKAALQCIQTLLQQK